MILSIGAELKEKDDYERYSDTITFELINCYMADCTLDFVEARVFEEPQMFSFAVSKYVPEVIEVNKKYQKRWKQLRQIKIMNAALQTIIMTEMDLYSQDFSEPIMIELEKARKRKKG